MVLIGCSILPHGSMILDPTIDDIPVGVDELHSASKYVGDYVRDHEPDIIVIATPHGLNLSESIGVYASNIGIGTADWNKNWSDFRVSCNIHDEFATDIYNHLQVNNAIFWKSHQFNFIFCLFALYFVIQFRYFFRRKELIQILFNHLESGQHLLVGAK